MLPEGRLGARQAWRVEGPWRPMARGVTLGDHSHMAQVLPLGTIRLAVTCALPVQNVQTALRLLGTGVDHDQGFPLPDRFGIRANLAVGDPEVKKPALEILRALQRTPDLEREMLRRWGHRMGGG